MLEKEKERSALKRTYHPAQEKRVHVKGVFVVANKKMEENKDEITISRLTIYPMKSC